MRIFACFAAVLVGVLFVILKAVKMSEMEKENQLIQVYMNSMESFYAMIRNRIEMTRRYRHDLAKHIQTLEILMRREQAGDIRDYMDGLKIQYRQLKSEEYTSNEVINTVISIKKQQCSEKGIPLQLELANEDYAVLSDIDMVGLLYNLLDNAVEASDRVSADDRKGILLKMDRQSGQMQIMVQNYVAPDEEIKFETYKEEKEEHGIGMKIIDYLVKKYNGTNKVEINGKKNLFIVRISLPVPEEQTEQDVKLPPVMEAPKKQ